MRVIEKIRHEYTRVEVIIEVKKYFFVYLMQIVSLILLNFMK